MWSCGITQRPVFPVRTLRPPMTHGISIFFPESSRSFALSSAFSFEPGPYARIGSFTGISIFGIPVIIHPPPSGRDFSNERGAAPLDL